MYLRNQWYVAAWPSEIGAAPLARTFLDEPVVLFRAKDGSAHALEDRCCHRNLPLSLGKIEGDNLRCGYHGLLFDTSGKCIEVPGQSQIPPGAFVRSYPLVEKWKLLWVWMGDPKLADPALIPDWHYLDDPAWVAAHGNDEKPLLMRCNWELNNDNLLDLSHFAYVHAAGLGTGAPGEFPQRTMRGERSVAMERFMPNQVPITLLAKHSGASGNVDRWAGSDITAPCHCIVDAGFAPLGKFKAGEERPENAFGFRACITATPETERTSLMFYAQCRNFLIDNAEITKIFVTDFRNLFLEDIAVMEAQQRVNDAMPDAPTIDINVDGPHLAMRALIRGLAARGQGTRQAAE
jgi:phenylpropionate dioxygenase-like ring-hydroxylating dioxygenase large terminal subunit